jgi:hypothetical protein
MKKGYTMLADGRGSDFGECVVVDQLIGEVILGEKHLSDLPQDMINYLCNNFSGEISDEQMEEVEDSLFDSNSYDSDVYTFLVNLLYYQKQLKTNNPYVLNFNNIAQLANFTRSEDVEILDNLLQD